ncbi:MAG: hypothetical protein E7J97_04660 [Citrobacter sp.]|uniref:hypothetical protein n=2 Tax=Enterobacterales TaxID=91347 RepID=UPI0024C108D2|nr:hypothetical protein [Citrobacter freundii]MDU7720082.1 hypothetical protein [Citrobacter sp.]
MPSDGRYFFNSTRHIRRIIKTVWRYKKNMAFEFERKTPQDVLVFTDSPVFHKRTVILDLAADVTCGDVINPTTGAAYVAADADNCAVALQNQVAGDARSLVISDTQCLFNPSGLVVAAAAKDAAYAALVKQGNRISDANTAI